jgi:CRP/FNR family transcriptional regulator, dissimilatory nitrate respiration regulator
MGAGGTAWDGGSGDAGAARAVRSHRLFADLSEAALAELLTIARESRHPRRAVLFRQGDSCTGFYVVLAGMVRLYKSSPDGREHVVEVIRPGQSFAEAAVFAGRACPVTAETLEPSRLLFFPKAPYLSYLEARPQVLFGLIAGLSVRMHQLVAKVERLTLMDARQRVAGFFADLAAAPAPPDALDVSKGTLAAQLGLTPETLSRTLASLQAEGVIAMDGRHFTVTDPASLAALARGGETMH